MSEYTMSVGGRAVPGERFFFVINPATGAPFAEAPDCTLQQLDLAIEVAQSAYRSWRKDEQKRRQALRDCARVVSANIPWQTPTFTLRVRGLLSRPFVHTFCQRSFKLTVDNTGGAYLEAASSIR
jgi:hypothetical protein